MGQIEGNLGPEKYHLWCTECLLLFPRGGKSRGRDVAKIGFTLLSLMLASVLVCAQDMTQVLRDPPFDPKGPLTADALKCSQSEKIVVPVAVAKRAKLKARLVNLLRESLFDDAKGVVNASREREIRKLANQLKNDRSN